MWKFKNIFWWATTIINTLFILFNLYYTCHWYSRVPDLDFDYIGVIVGILSALITIAVGWQIFYQLKIEDRLKDVAKTEVEKAAYPVFKGIIGNTLKRDIEEVRYYINVKDYNRALWIYIYILRGYIELEDKDNVVGIVEQIDMLLHKNSICKYTFCFDGIKDALKLAIRYTDSAYELLKELESNKYRTL